MWYFRARNQHRHFTKDIPINLHALLRNTDLFGQLSEESRQKVAAIAVERAVKKNQTLFMEGDEGRVLYLLVSGSVRLSKSNEGGDRNVVIKTLKPNELFGEVVLFEADSYPVTATAMRDSVLFAFSKREFLGLLENADFRNEFIRILIRKQRYLTERLRLLATMDVADKFFHYLRLQYGEKERIVPGLSKKELAEAIDMTPETLSRLLLKLGGKRGIVWKGREITLPKGFWRMYYPKFPR